ALEVNATIPALVGYSDMASRALLETLGTALGVVGRELEGLILQNGSNAAALHAALQAGYGLQRPGQVARRVAILCRRQDPQMSELRHCASRFAELGTE